VFVYLGRHPPNPHTLSPSTTHIWIGGILYVDDLALMSTCSCKLQAMLHGCQQCSIRDRMQINTDKTKNGLLRPCPPPRPGGTTPALLRARGGQPLPSSAPGGDNISLAQPCPHFHAYSPFRVPTSDPRSYPIHEVFQFEYLGLILNSKLIMHLATVEAIRRHGAAQGQALALAVSCSL